MQSGTETSVTQQLAAFTAEVSYDDLPPKVVHETKRMLLDAIGCALGGATVAKGKGAISLARDMGGQREASVLGEGLKVPCPVAAFANAELVNALEFDALLMPAHISPFVVSPPLAAAEHRRVSGKTLLLAMAVAHEIGARVGVSMQGLRQKEGVPERAAGMGGGVFGAAAGVCKVLEFDRDETANAFGLAGVLAPVPSTAKFMHAPFVYTFKYAPAGWIAQAGMTAALLTQKGYTGDPTILDGERGFWAMHGSQGFSPERVTKDLGREWLLLTTQYKKWPNMGGLHSLLDVFAQIVEENDLAPEEIEQVTVKADPLCSLPFCDRKEMRSHMDAQFRTAYAVALAAHRVRPGPEWQSHAYWEDPKIRRFMEKVRFEVYPRCRETWQQEVVQEGRPFIIKRPGYAEVVARGRTSSKATEYASWAPVDIEGIRATDEALQDKFRVNAEGQLPKEKIERAMGCLFELDSLDDVRKLMEGLSPGTSRPRPTAQRAVRR